MHPIADEVLKNSGVLLVSLQKFAAIHAPEYRRTVDAVLQAEENQEALVRGHDIHKPIPRYKRRGHVKHRLILAWDAALAGTESILQRASRMVHGASRLLFRCADYIGDRRPLCVFECSVCDHREHESGCYFADEQVLCLECVVDVLVRCNAGRQADEPTFTGQMLVELWTLYVVPYWRRTAAEAQWLSDERDVRAVRRADIDAAPAPVRARWKHALGLIASRLTVARESADDLEDANLATKSGISTILEEA